MTFRPLTHTPRAVVARTLVAGLAALAFSACSSSSSSNATTATVPADIGLHVIAGPGIRFDTGSYTATAGEVKVLYTNNDSQRHTLAIIDPAGKSLPGELEVAKSGATDTGSYTLTPGTYKIICTVPGHTNMKATLTVS